MGGEGVRHPPSGFSYLFTAVLALTHWWVSTVSTVGVCIEGNDFLTNESF